MVIAPCNNCGDLSKALEWTAWTSCTDEISGGVIKSKFCRKRGNAHIGFEKEVKGKVVI